MATVDLLINGVSYWVDTVYESCHFESQVNGVAGPCAFRVRDPDRTKTFVPGQTILLTVDGSAVWRGFVSMVNRVFVFPALNVSGFGLARFIDIVGIDINILLSKRIVYNQATPTTVQGPLVAAHTPDSTAIATLFASWIDLSGDGLDTTSFVENVADTTWTQEGTLWEGSDTWGQAMQSIANLPAAIYYIDPDKNFVYTDVDTPSAPFNLSDQPNGTTTRGYREMEVLKDGTGLANDVMAWGMGYGSQTPVFVRDTDATSQADHGLWQLSQMSFGVYKQATIDRIAQSIIDGSPQNKRGAKNDRVAVQCVTYVPGLRPAQKVDFTSNAFGFNDVIPIRKMEIDFPAADTPKYSLTLSHEIDTPFGFFDPFLLHLPYPKCPPPLVMGPNGKCIMPPIIDPPICDCGITDTFTRTVASGWGTSDAEVAWQNSGSSSVASGVGTISAIRSGIDGPDASLVYQSTHDFSVTFDFKFTTGTLENGYSDSFSFSIGSTSVTFLNDLGTTWKCYTYADGIGEVATSDVSPLTGGAWYSMRLEQTPTTLRFRYWLSADPEPGWLLDGSIVGDSWWGGNGLYMVILANAPTGPDLIMDFDNLDIPGVNRCAVVQFDNFDRTVASGLGTASPSGYVWTPAVVINSSANVTASYANFLNGSGITGCTYNASISGLPFAHNADFTATALMYLSSDGRITNVGFNWDSMSYGWQRSGGSSSLFLNAGGGLVTVAYPDVFWDTLYGPAVMKAERLGGIARIKLWDLGIDPEPDWQLTTTVAEHTYQSGIFVGLLSSYGGASNEYVSIDSIDFGYARKPCYLGGPPAGSGISSNAWACEQFDVVTTILALAHPFLVNSPRVWLNGLLQAQSSYTQNGTAGTITFGFTPSPTDNARVCYWATA